MTSETLARAGTRGRLVALEARAAEGRGMTEHDGVWVSTVLTSTPHRRCTPERNRSIPTISAGFLGGRLAHVSAVDTSPRRSESGVLTAQPDASVIGPPPPLPARCLHRVPVVMVRRRVRQEWARVGLLHEGRDPLAKGCAYCTKAPPTRSAPHPLPVAPPLRAVHPDDAGSHQRDRVSLLRQAETAALPSDRPTPPVFWEVVTSETLRSHETTQHLGVRP